MATLRIHFTTDLGAHVSVETPEDALFETMRHYGRLGWVSGSVPPGGFRLPYDNETDFDWALLGGRKLEDGSVWCRGESWTRQEAAEAVRYSRPAKPTDPAGLRQTYDGEREQVTLAVFQGGERQEAYAAPAPSSPLAKARKAVRQEAVRQEQAPESVELSPEEVLPEEAQQEEALPDEAVPEEAPAPLAVPEGVLKMWANIGLLLKELEAAGKRDAAEEAMAELAYAHETTQDIETGRKVYRELRALLK